MKVKNRKRSEKNEKSSRKNIYSVEKILDKKIKKGKTFYFIKWFNYSDNHNTWEPEKNVKISPGLLEEYEREQKENSIEEEKRAPRRVIGLVDDPNFEFSFFVELQDGRMVTMPRYLAHQRCPQLVIEYYRSIFEFKESRSDGESDTSTATESSI